MCVYIHNIYAQYTHIIVNKLLLDAINHKLIVCMYIYIKRLHCFLLALTPLHFTNEKMKILNVHLFVKMNPALSARMTACFQVISQVKDDVCVCVCVQVYLLHRCSTTRHPGKPARHMFA